MSQKPDPKDYGIDALLPASVDSERTILGSILLDNEAFFDDTLDIEASDFSLDSHRRIFLVMSEILFGLVEGATHVDIVTLANELGKRKWVEAVGGVAYLASLTEGLPRRPVIEDYVRICKDKARLRRLMAIFNVGLARAQDQSETADQVRSAIQDQLGDEEAEGTSHSVEIGSCIPAVEERITKSRVISSERTALEMTWGLSGLDEFTKGAFAGEFTVISGESSGGKLMDVDELIPTPQGFVRNGDLQDGDEIFGEDGEVHRVLKAHPIQEEEAFEVSFDDGTSTFVHAGHLWHTWTHVDKQKKFKQSAEFRAHRRATRPDGKGKGRFTRDRSAVIARYIPPLVRGSIKTTEEIMTTLMHRRASNHSIPLSKPLQMPWKNLPIDPYVLGAWLGDGSSSGGRITIGPQDAEELSRLLGDHGYPVRKTSTVNDFTFSSGDYRQKARNHSFQSVLTAIGLKNNKHIPEEYFWACESQRLELLRGLMDTDGCCFADGQAEFSNMNRDLSVGVYRLAASLGVRPCWREKRASVNGKYCGISYVVKWTSTLECFALRRKVKRLPKKRAEKASWRHIVNVVPVGKMKMRCLTTSNPSGLYLFGVNCNITHNTAAAVQMTLANAREGIPCAWFSMEMSKEKVAQRYYAAMSDILTTDCIRDPRLMTLHTHIPEMKRVSEELARLPIRIDDTSPLRVDKLRSRIRMMTRKFKIRLFVIDYVQLLQGMPGLRGTEQFANTIYMLRDIPKDEPTVHLVVLSQYSKADGFMKKKGRTTDSNFGGSVISHAAQNMLMISIEDPDKRDRADLLDVEIKIAKQREGRRGKITCNFDRDHLRFCYPQRQMV